jgi:hypothetical protein
MTTTMQLIAKQTVGSGGAASVTFSNIPQTYTDLKIVCSTRNNSTAEIFDFGFNGVTTNQSSVYLNGSGSSATSGTYTLFGRSVQVGATASTFSNNEIYIPNYTSTNAKSVSIDAVNENNATGAYASLVAGLWNPGTQAPITSITFTASGSFVEFSTFYLYGISNSTTTQASTVPYASGGDVITTDGSYWYHTFLYSGTFTPLKALTCDYLVVAGGGGGGGDAGAPGGGGGGAGGYRTSIGGTALSLTAQAYVATVGAGGAAGAPSTASYTGVNGGNSIFSTITSNGGGGGAGSIRTDAVTSQSGGSGGGGARPETGNTTMPGGSGNTPSTTPSQGNNGGNGWHNSGTSSNGGGGGGAGAAGQNANTVGRGGDGGTGIANSISGTSVTYAGGGGGGSDTGNNGAGGAGGGGAGGGTGVAGTANRGGGGGGAANYNSAGGNGGSGIIIVRYAV